MYILFCIIIIAEINEAVVWCLLEEKELLFEVCVSVRAYVCACVRERACACVCVHVRVYEDIHMYIIFGYLSVHEGTVGKEKSFRYSRVS